MKTTGQEFFAARPGSRIAAPQFDIPEERRIRFHTEQWVIGSLAAIARIVANFSAFLVTKGRDHCAIQIEDETRAMLRQVNKSLQKSVIGKMQLLAEMIRGVQQESPQSLWVGKTLQARQVLKASV